MQSINEVKRVIEMSFGDIREGKDVNQHLSEGWILLHVYSNAIDSDHGPSQIAVYVLGWTGEGFLPE